MFMQFNEFEISDYIQHAISEQGFETATEIQQKAIPEILSGKDVIGLSSTGTGKTAAFGIPCLELAKEADQLATILILSPTRELALQTAGELRKFAKYLHGVGTAVLYGGAPMDSQIFQLKKAKIVIGTPGRVMDHIRRRTLKLENLKTIVLDEADEMLNMGFVDDIKTILETAPETRQTVLFSATMPKQIVEITKEFQTNPVTIKVLSKQKTADNIVQNYYDIPQGSKIDTLKLLLEYHNPKRALIFCNTKKMVDELCGELCNNNFKAVGIHGDLKQNQRTTVMNEFKAGKAKILIATDVAARGIDVEDVEAVFNYDIPQEYEYYIHRIGRTGRAGKSGASYTLVANRAQLARIRQIEKYIKAPISEMPVPTLESIAETHTDKFAQNIRDMVTDGVGDDWVAFIRVLVDEGYSAEDIAAVLCQKLQKKSTRLKNVRNVASVSTGKKVKVAQSGRCWLSISIGSDNKIAPNFIVSALTQASGLPSSAIGKINIYSDHTDVDISNDDASLILSSMQGVKIKDTNVVCNIVKESSKKGKYGGKGGRGFGSSKGEKPYKSEKPYKNKKGKKSGNSDKFFTKDFVDKYNKKNGAFKRKKDADKKK